MNEKDNGAPKQPSMTARRAGSDTTHSQPLVVYHADARKSMEVLLQG